jgi:hypothetical protein
MSSNPLKIYAPNVRALSHFSAADYAAQARAKGLEELAKDWEKAGREGWDERNYDPEEARKYQDKIRKSWRDWR